MYPGFHKPYNWVQKHFKYVKFDIYMKFDSYMKSYSYMK